MKKILIFSNESGGGHKQTAQVLSQFLQKENRVIKIISTFQELFSDLDHGARFFGISGEDTYNQFLLQKEAPSFFYKCFFFTIYYSFIVPYRKLFIKRFTAFFEQEKPDLIISVIPIINREIAAAINNHSPFLIIQTDLFEYQEKSWLWRKLVPCGAWFVRDKNAYQVSGTHKGYQQALTYNSDPHKVQQLSGTVISPRFLQTKTLDVSTERKQLGLNSEQPVGLFLYGGHPPQRVFKLAKQLDKLNVTAQFFFICGKNETLRKRLENLPTRYSKIIMGYSQEIPYYMQVADFLIGKPGPGTIMESIALNLPLLLDVSHVMPHEANNAPWVEQQNLGMSFKTPQQLMHCIEQLSNPSCSIIQQHQVFKNRAVFEVAKLVEQLLSDSTFRS